MGRASFRQADVKRLVRGAIDAGWPVGTFAVQVIDGRPTLIPIDLAAAPAMVARPMDEADALDAAIRAVMDEE